MKHICDSCSWVGTKLDEIDNIGSRIEAGSEVPSGQCPECGALCYLDRPTSYAKVEWHAADVQTLRKSWNLVKCEIELSKIAKYLQERVTELGWEALDGLLPKGKR